MTVVIGTAGHIDHGKTTLLRALTGIDADRLPEEQARGMTIDVGYAHLRLDDGSQLDFVDVPGHDRLVGNMLVGAGEIDAALLIVAADDGPRAQTLEHLELLDAIGVGDGLAVVTKIDAVAPDRVAEVVHMVHALLRATGLADVAVVPASSLTGVGIDAVRRALVEVRDRAAASTGAMDRNGPPRTPAVRLDVDRVFAVRGRGTVVTGTLRGAEIRTGALLNVVPGGPGTRVRVREIQVHNRTVDAAGPGRVAVNVAGDAVHDLRRGVVVTNDPAVVGTDRLLVALRPVAQVGGATAARSRSLPADRACVVVHAGTDHTPAVVGRAGREAVDLSGGEATAILRLERPLAMRPGDRLVIRRPSPGEPLAGGTVLDPEPVRGIGRRRATPDRLRALAATAPGSSAWVAARLDVHGVSREPTALATDVAAEIETVLVAGVGPDGARRSELIRLGEARLRRLVGSTAVPDDILGRLVAERLDASVDSGRLDRDGDRIRRPGAATTGPTPELLAAMDRLVDRLAVAAPPSLRETADEVGCPPDAVRELERTNRIVRLDDDLAWAFSTYRELAGRAVAMASRAPLTPAAYRDATGTSRKYVMAILEDLDRRAILSRTAAGHVPGPRAQRREALAAGTTGNVGTR
jgi:selenocysteine-specific elongation factor